MNLKQLRAEAGLHSLLSRHNSNPKIAKATWVRSSVLHLAPGNLSGYEVCPSRSPGCTAACLHFAGNPLALRGKERARVARTKLFFENRPLFLQLLHAEIAAAKRAGDRRGMPLAVRLNGTSDLAWERIDRTLFDEFSDVSFYDYTAVVNRLRGELPRNYHLTFSLKEDNLSDAIEAIDRGFNVAAVFYDTMPDFYLGLPVIDGDAHDYRPTDPYRCIVGLSAKGQRAKGDITGFIHRGEHIWEKFAA